MNPHALEVLEYGRIKELLTDHATSGLGKRAAQQVRPLKDMEEIEKLKAETTELKELLAPARELPIGGLHDLFPLLDKLDRGEEVLLIEELLLFADTLRAGRIVRAFLEDAEEACPTLGPLAGAINTCPEIEEKIASTFNEGGAIKNTASPRLKSLRRTIEELRSRIRGKLQSLLRDRNVGPYLQDTGIREIKGRPTVALKAQHASRMAGLRRDRSESGGTVFVEPEAVRGMGDELEGTLDAEKAEMRRILQEITGLIAARSELLRQTLDALAHLDMTYAKVRLSRTFEMNPVHLNTEGQIRLYRARHPLLLELQQRTGSPEEVVPIDLRLGDDFNTLIITGPNTGGKTVTLKTAGLLTLMAQSGMHVPAAPESSLAVFENVLADIGDEQSIEQSLSTFSSHLQHIAKVLEQANEKTLVLMDELGGGTDPAEGAALARSILAYLHERRVRTVVTTHISDLKKLGYTVPQIENASIEFDPATLRPTYRLVIGTPGSSNALAVARRLGLPEEVIARAQESPRDESAELIDQLQAAKVAMAGNQHVAERARTEALGLEEQYRRKLEELASREEEIQKRVREEGFAALHAARRAIDQLCQREPSRRNLLESLREISASMAAQLEESPLEKKRKSLQAGDEVLVRSLNRVGVLKEIDEPGRKAVVQLGALPMKVSLEDIDPA